MPVTYVTRTGGIFKIMLYDEKTLKPNLSGPHWWWNGNDVDGALQDIFLYFHKRYSFCAYDQDVLHIACPGIAFK